MNKYEPQAIEPKWQKIWADTKLYAAITGDASRPKYYMLTEFPYPSGAGLHAGHAREYTLGDVISRYKRMQGYNVLYPMGFDAFGLPTENYAIKNKMRPQDATAENVKNFVGQMESLGLSFDWDRVVNTTDPGYYKWTQWLFLKFFEQGLAYQAEMPINWCPKEKTGLANEEVVDGKHERCGTPVEKKLLKQWMFRITEYADRLIEGLKTVDYPPRIADQQINWIGRSEGAEITWAIEGLDGKAGEAPAVTVYTTRPDTLMGATFLVVSPEVAHTWMESGWKPHANVASYIMQALAATELSRQEDAKTKTGEDTGLKALHPVTGEPVPVWVADYVLGSYGTGAIMAVPAHDERDLAAAEAFNLPVQPVITAPNGGEPTGYTGYGKLMNSGEFDGLEGTEAKRAITAWLFERGLGKGATKYKLRDWIFSRQHYWGEPIPIIHCPKDGAVAVPTDQLPVTLPDVTHYEPTDTGESPLAAIADWVNVTCPTCGGPAKRETDTMPNWAGSSWYYLRFMDATNDKAFASPEALAYWGEVDLYLGGMEHTTLHLLYSRFWHQFLYDQKLVPTPEPYAARRGQGIVLASDGRKMSKSWGNVINPTEIVERYGADTFRLYILFMAPYDETTPWSDERLNGASRFAYRVWDLFSELLADKPVLPGSAGYDLDLGDFELEVDRTVHKTIKRIHDDLGDMKFNTCVSTLMELLNFLAASKNRDRLKQDNALDLKHRTLRTFALLLAPFMPHLAEELWHELGGESSVHISGWPTYDPELIKDELVTIVVQVNGKVRGNVAAAPESTNDELTALAAADPKVAGYLAEGTIVKTIVVPRKLVNFVIKPRP